jgi:hypothetical protein
MPYSAWRDLKSFDGTAQHRCHNQESFNSRLLPLEDCADQIASNIRRFPDERVCSKSQPTASRKASVQEPSSRVAP